MDGNVYVKSFGGKNNCEPKNCTLCEDDIVFTKNRSTLETGRQRMIPGKQYTLYDESFEDYPNPDECMMYNADDKKFVFRNCSESQGVQCVNETYDHYAVKACFQENPDGFSCIPEMKDQKKLIKTGPYFLSLRQ
ncbi:uncharacterized protein LOC133197053 [Saccostrea echinata]|uniref:uncharacterized protein LOC133197053 n=1 Tax=Saccostrea echinata TaxID=191078 RepID=UPI002A83A9F5|nr:uncharacterized protein LOC133197053 [Saccostrea echinata]